MDNSLVVAAFVREQYGLPLAALHCISQHSPERAVYQVESVDGRNWLLRLHRTDQPIPPWVTAQDMLEWLTRQATVLDWCRQQHIPAPELCPTQAGTELAFKAG